MANPPVYTSDTYTSGRAGDRWDRNWLVGGITASDVPNAIIEVFAQIPNIGDAAPAPLTNVFVADATITSFACAAGNALGQATGVLTYTTPSRSVFVPNDTGPGVTLTGGGAIQEIDVFRDINGDQLRTTFDNVTMGHKVRGFEVSSAPTFTRVEVTSPRARADAYVGRVNSLVWNSYAARTVLCASIEGESQDRGATFVNTYTFHVRPSWDVELYHDDPFYPGNPVPTTAPFGTPAAPGERTRGEILPAVDFGPLGIVLA